MKRAWALLIVASSCAHAVEIRIQYGALERLLADMVFTQDGRRYMRGTKTAKCNFAYLEKPEVRGENGLLRIKANFTGRSALNLLGQCVGVGDAFEAVITATPVFRNGALGLQQVRVGSNGKTSYYIRHVCEAMESSLAHDFKVPLAANAKALLENPEFHPAYRRELNGFDVPEIRVTNDALVLSVYFELTIK